MTEKDPKILAALHREGNLTPKAIDKYTAISAHNAHERCQVLVDRGMLEQIAHGLYRLTDEGRAFLEE